MTNARPRTADTTPVPSRLWWLATVLAAGSVMAGLDTSLVNVGLATIGHALHVSLVKAQWTSSGYLLALAAALPTCGWLSRRFGAGRVWLAALVAFTLTSALCAAAPGITALIAARVLQGVAGGLLVPTSMSILGQAAGARRMGRVIAISSVPAILAPAVGPVVGALLIANLSWHWLFLVNLPVGALGLVLGARWVPRGERSAAGRLDVPSLLLVVVGLPLVVLAITEAADKCTTNSAAVWVPGAVGAGALILFVRRATGRPAPLMDLRPAANPVFRAAAAEVFFVGAALFGGMIVLPLYFQLQLGQSVVHTGLLLMAFSVGAAVTFPLAGVLADRYGGGIVAVAGLVVTVASTVPMALLSRQPNLVTVEFLQFARGVGLALAGSPGVSAALATVDRDQMPDASAGVNILSRVGGALGSALFTVVLSNGEHMTAHGGTLVAAFHRTFWWLVGAAGAALIAAAWLAMAQRRATADGQTTTGRPSRSRNPAERHLRIRWGTNDRYRSVGSPTSYQRSHKGTQ